MAKLLMFLALFGLLQHHISHAQLMECFKCTDTTECSKDRDFCDGHDRCLKMEYKNSNGALVNDARCSHESKCDTELGIMMLCEKKKDCKINTCCKNNLCNSPAVWVRLDMKLFATVAMAIYILLKRW